MRLCRFLSDNTTLVGFYFDDHVVPFDLALEACGETDLDEYNQEVSDDLMAYLPPDGPNLAAARSLHVKLAMLQPEERLDLGIPLENVRLLVPVPTPPKLLLLAGNYAKHVQERGGVVTEQDSTFPYVFMKPTSTTLTHPGDPIVIPRISPDAIDWECELGVLIGREARHVAEADALEVVAGYTVINDITDRRFRPNPARTSRPRDEHFDWLHGKWHDTFCPAGPCVLAHSKGFNPQTFQLRLKLNGQIKQDAGTDQMVFSVASLIAFLSSMMTLEPGDTIATGTPAGVGSATGEFLRPGDLLEAEVVGIGVLKNPVVAESRPG
jgi:2-keto-4-pentenoate hydratase/2-oxohepta-3-ene-1,7-dioic acid hydratase in catechol pathway